MHINVFFNAFTTTPHNRHPCVQLNVPGRADDRQMKTVVDLFDRVVKIWMGHANAVIRYMAPEFEQYIYYALVALHLVAIRTATKAPPWTY